MYIFLPLFFLNFHSRHSLFYSFHFFSFFFSLTYLAFDFLFIFSIEVRPIRRSMCEFPKIFHNFYPFWSSRTIWKPTNEFANVSSYLTPSVRTISKPAYELGNILTLIFSVLTRVLFGNLNTNSQMCFSLLLSVLTFEYYLESYVRIGEPTSSVSINLSIITFPFMSFLRAGAKTIKKKLITYIVSVLILISF